MFHIQYLLMALNKNHEFEELNGIKCGIVERNVKPERAEFLKHLLTYNGFTVVIVSSPPPKVAAAKPLAEGEEPTPPPTSPTTFTVGVTDYTFNPINAIFGRQLKTTDNTIVTLAYWNQEEPTSNNEVPYFENKETWK